jgi:hypothetical protein
MTKTQIFRSLINLKKGDLKKIQGINKLFLIKACKKIKPKTKN